MTSLKQAAANQKENKTILNISNLEKVSTDMNLENREFTNKETGEPYQIKVIVINDQEYRVPVSVLIQLKSVLEIKPNLKYFKVIRKGETRENTRYTVVPLD